MMTMVARLADDPKEGWGGRDLVGGTKRQFAPSPFIF